MNENRSIEIYNVSLKNRKPIISFSENYNKDVNGEEKPFTDTVDGKKFGRRIDNEFFSRWESLRVHFAILCGYVRQDTVDGEEMYQENEEDHSPYKLDILETVEIKKISISTKKGNRSVIITATKTTDTNRCVTINTPLTEIDNPDPYLFSESLQIDIDLLMDEVHQYLLRGKDGESQLELSFNDGISEVEFDEGPDQPNSEMKVNTDEHEEDLEHLPESAVAH